MTGTWTSSEDEDFGSLGDNLVIVTGGTSGTPATFADFVTADRAGEAVLLAATAGLSPTLALTFALRPADVTALLISFIVASKTTETDHIFITGTDWRGAAQTENIDVSAGNATYVSTKYFATISNIDCSDSNTGGGTQWADGTVRVTQPQWGLIWDFSNNQYQMLGDLDVGDNSTSTYFASEDEMVYFVGFTPRVRSAATLRIGKASNDFSGLGSYWRMKGESFGRTLSSGSTSTWLTYGSILRFETNFPIWNGGALTFKQTNMFGYSEAARIIVHDSTVSLTVEDLYVQNTKSFEPRIAPSTFLNVHYELANDGLFLFGADLTADGLLVTNSSFSDAQITDSNARTLTLKDPRFHVVNPVIKQNESSVIIEQYTCNIHVADRAGVNLQSVTVLCEDDDANQIFSVITAANGDITEQTVNFKSWTGTLETVEDFSPHKFTISKAGYETLILEAITVDHPLVWHLELQRPKAPPRAWRH